MKQYHYSDGVNSYGPYSLEELKSKDINSETLIWSEDLVTWKKAEEVAELKELFAFSTKPVLPPSSPHTTAFDPVLQRPPKTYLIESILTMFFCCLPLGIVSCVYASRVEKKFYSGDIQGSEEASANAKRWLLINIGVSAVLILGYFAVFALAIFGAA